jgi:hypothetical protein
MAGSSAKDLALDWEDVIDGRVGPPAGAEAVRPAEHDEPAAEVVDVLREQPLLRPRDVLGGDVLQHDRVVPLHRGDRAGHARGVYDVELDAVRRQ